MWLATTEVQVQTVEEFKTKASSYVLPNKKREGEDPLRWGTFSPKSLHTTLGSRIQHQNFRGSQGFRYTYWSHMTLDGTRKNWIIKGGQLRENWAQSLKLSLGWWHRSIASCPWEANAKGSRFPSGLGYSVSSRLAVGEDKERVLNWPGTSHGFE